ncbi:MAG: hypothetical protein A2X94_12710 [Bdellovibrionales bacterium GWB1_55_8]|nr:MAG: hypothetical protein A2X94_12710 [Bdellovibrionales bacterium GWB1_55_8]
MPTWLFPRTRSFYYGLLLPLEALKLIFKHPVLIFLSIIPILITLVLYILLITGMQEAARGALLGYLTSIGLDPQGWISWIALLLTKIILFIISALTFSIVAAIVASPFNDILAEKTESRSPTPLVPSPISSWRNQLRLISIDVLKSVAAGVAALAAILLSWVPVVNFFALLLAFLLLTFQYISYPQTRRNEGVRDGLRFLWRHSYSCTGFGATLSILFAIPLISSLALPLAVVGGTLLVSRARADATHPLLR